MRNKVKLKKLIFKIIILSIFILCVSVITNIFEYNLYTKNFNNKLESIVGLIEEKYPDITDNEIIEIINSKSNKSNILKKYNIDINNDSVLLENKILFNKLIIINNLLLILVIGVLLYSFLRFNSKKDKELNEITKYIEEINKKNYKLNIEENSEDELSILKNEIYKVTIMLKEQAENSNKDKMDLKVSLSDISHQLKTPLTSILIILDNLLEDDNMNKEVRQDFIFDIKREINNINFLVQSLLKLSNLDTNTVNFVEKEVSLEKIVKEALKKLSCVSDLKNVNINLNILEKANIIADEVWQVEAVSNIIKNCIEHSKENSNIDISIDKNKIYSEIVIKDYGTGIEKGDLPHIFERFYKGKSASKDSIGIGLALAKSIIEKTNGKIIVDSKIGYGTTFTIKYYK